MKVLVFAAMLFASSFASAQAQTCKDFEGKWEGSKVGAGYEGALTITFQADCKYEWVGSSGPITQGVLTLKTEEAWYANTAGSRGKVKKSGEELVWKNVWTGNNYEVKVRKLSM